MDDGDDGDAEQALLARFGLRLDARSADAVRALLHEIAERDHGVGEETQSMRVLCAALFGLGDVRDSVLVWRAKSSSFDAGCSIDVQLLAGAGLDPTMTFLDALDAAEPRAAAVYLRECVAAGDFDDFTPSSFALSLERYYLGP